MKKIKISNIADEIISNGLISGEEFIINAPFFDGYTFKCVNCYPDETGDVPCSEPSCECMFYGFCETVDECPMTRLINEYNKMVVMLNDGVMCSTW